MKKFSTAGLLFALACTAASAATSTETPSTAAKCQFLDNAPDQHQVVRGDTLWSISGRFLQHPWCWPQVWGINRDQISNPHWIYPGQTVYFDRASGQLRLARPVGSEGGLPTVRMSPQIRMENMAADAIPAIPASVIEPFLTQPLLIEEGKLADAPRVLQGGDGHVYMGKGDVAYVRGRIDGDTVFQVYRPSQPLRDPDTGAILGYEAAYLGTMKLTRAARADDEAHRFVVTSSVREIGVGAQLVPMPPTPIVNYVPHRPQVETSARVMSVYGGVAYAGQNNVVTINRGSRQGLDAGSVLELYRRAGVVADRAAGNQPVRLPDERYGSVFVFRTFDNVSYGLVMQVTAPVRVGDVARSPE
ncbi:LysM peptidoglycan-binding domain-containing protein [Noviherbaspirillum soli]|uniref:LysM peptidoglycan-binding domain-containing protein n=1 Tax=Noviherbaspirillum soli TaxID=1064518 RepID=UPI00188A107B|nr:LysM peptidoglycan-binding domain-containing protein [Noviherbaspirillum soli]